MNVEIPISEVDTILKGYRDDLGDAFSAYRNHVCRVLNYCFALRQCDDDERQKLIIAGCFHDLGIWPSGTLDYLAPSVTLAAEYLATVNQSVWSDEIGQIIEMHHKIRSVQNDASPLVELFRRADLIDVSLGLQRFGVPRSFIKQVSATYPNRGFHKTLLRLGVKQFLRSPWNPMPMLKW